MRRTTAPWLLLPLLTLISTEAAADARRATCADITEDLLDKQIDQYRAQAMQRLRQAQRREQAEERRRLGVRRDRETTLEMPTRSGAAPSPAPQSAPVTDEDASFGDLAAKRPSKPRAARRPSASRSRAVAESRAAGGKAAKAKSKADGPRNYSRTNTQELMVDEGDIVKTNGRRIYHVSCRQRGHAARCRDEIRVYASWPARRTELLSRYQIPTRGGAVSSIRQLYLSGDHVVALLDAPRRAAARVVVLDMKNARAPEIVRELEVDGGFVESRMIGQSLYLATASRLPSLPAHFVQQVQVALTTWSDAQLAAARPTAAEVIARLPSSHQSLSAVDLGLPSARAFYGEAVSARSLYDCDAVRLRTPLQGQLLNLAHIDLSSDVMNGAGVTGYGPGAKVYASERAFYVATQATPRPGRGWSQSTEVRKFRLGPQGPRFVAAGQVRGLPLNQFAMSEFEGHLRIATSEGWRSNGLYVLAEKGERLDTIGQLEGFGRSERIFAVRMMGSKGYVVTFRRTDPLYTLDLTRPEHPKLVGALKIEGWSSYLHPLDEDHLLAIGQDADPRGRTIGFHMQIFDVSDPRRPRRTYHEKLEAGSISAAQSDHHAFMFEPTTKTLAVPWKGTNYWGLLAYRVDSKSGFTRLGRVNHASMYKRWFETTCRRVDRGECAKKNYWWGFFSRPDLDVDRVVAIDGHLYSLSPSGVMVHRVNRRSLSRVRAALVSVPEWPGARATPHGAVAVKYRR